MKNESIDLATKLRTLPEGAADPYFIKNQNKKIFRVFCDKNINHGGSFLMERETNPVQSQAENQFVEIACFLKI